MLKERIKELRENGVSLRKAISVAFKERHCKYCMYIAHYNECHCGAYSKSKHPSGKWWAHFPKCKNANCPLKHPKLLDGAKLDLKRK